MNDINPSRPSKRPVTVQIRPHRDGAKCDVVLTARGREVAVTCPTYALALRWARMECKSYQITPSPFDTAFEA